MYEPTMVMNVGLVLSLVQAKTDAILRFPDSASDRVLSEIEAFWLREEMFVEHGLPHKRGILLHGPPGSGKTSTVQLVCRDVVDRGGIVLLFNTAFLEAYRTVREIESGTPIVVLMEDLDEILANSGNQSKILNMLDGVEDMRKVCFLASTNYIERLQARIANRPSRFDRKVLIAHPSPANRKFYLEHLMRDEDTVDVAEWVRDTEGFSLAHIKELFVSVVLLGNEYRKVKKQLADMGVRETSSDDFVAGNYA